MVEIDEKRKTAGIFSTNLSFNRMLVSGALPYAFISDFIEEWNAAIGFIGTGIIWQLCNGDRGFCQSQERDHNVS